MLTSLHVLIVWHIRRNHFYFLSCMSFVTNSLTKEFILVCLYYQVWLFSLGISQHPNLEIMKKKQFPERSHLHVSNQISTLLMHLIFLFYNSQYDVVTRFGFTRCNCLFSRNCILCTMRICQLIGAFMPTWANQPHLGISHLP